MKSKHAKSWTGRKSHERKKKEEEKEEEEVEEKKGGEGEEEGVGTRRVHPWGATRRPPMRMRSEEDAALTAHTSAATTKSTIDTIARMFV